MHRFIGLGLGPLPSHRMTIEAIDVVDMVSGGLWRSTQSEGR